MSELQTIFKRNPILIGGLLPGLVIGGAINIDSAIVLSVAFGMVTFPTVLLCRFVPRKILYALRIALYAVVETLIYIPVYIFIENQFGYYIISTLGVYLPLILANPIIFSKTETNLFRRTYFSMSLETLGFCVGFAWVALLIGYIREKLYLVAPVPFVYSIFFGFVATGFVAAALRIVISAVEKANKKV